MPTDREKAEQALRSFFTEAKADPEWVEDGGNIIPGGTITKGRNGFLLIERPDPPPADTDA